MSSEDKPNKLSKTQWKQLSLNHWIMTQIVLSIHHMVQHYFGLKGRKKHLDPLMDLFETMDGKIRCILDGLVHDDFLDRGGNLKPGVTRNDCPSTYDGICNRILTIFYNPEKEVVLSYKPYDAGLKRPKKLQKYIPNEDRTKFIKDLTDLENFVNTCLEKLRPLMDSSKKYEFDNCLTKIQSCKVIISSLP